MTKQTLEAVTKICENKLMIDEEFMELEEATNLKSIIQELHQELTTLID